MKTSTTLHLPLAKRLALLALSAFLALFVSGCGDPVKDELLWYINERLALAGEAIDSSADAADMASALRKEGCAQFRIRMLPRYQNALTVLNGIELETPEVQKVHRKLVQAVTVMHASVSLLAKACLNSDADGERRALNQFNKGRDLALEFRRVVVALAREHGVQIRFR